MPSTLTKPRPRVTPDLHIDLGPRLAIPEGAVPTGPDLTAPGTLSRPRRGLLLLAILLVLNLFDAVLTSFVLRHGIAVEANPMIGVVGLPGKVVMVSLLSLVLWKVKPAALAIPVVAYAFVVTYTLTGIFITF